MSELQELLQIDASDNEAVSITFELQTEDSNGVAAAMDLTGLNFRAQIKATRDSSAAVADSFTITIDDDPTTGRLTLSLTESQVSTLGVGTFYYDLLMREGVDGPIDNLWVGVLRIRNGVSTW